jgi:YVTN family beta-propeller protein
MSRNSPRINRLLVGLLIGLLAAGLSVPALAQSVPFPTYQVGPNTNGPWVVSDGTIITPAGTQVDLGIRVRAKAVAVNPTGNHTAAVLTMGTSTSNGNGAVEVFNTETGAVLQSYSFAGKDSTGSSVGIAYTPDGSHLLFSQDSSHVTIATVNATTGLLSDDVQVNVPMDATSAGLLTNVTCFPDSPGGTTGGILIPCGYTVSIVSDGTRTSYPMGIAISKDGKTAYAVLDNNDTLTKINVTAGTQVGEVRVGNVPHSVVISADGNTAYVSNEAGRIATEKDFQGYSNGTPVVARYPEGGTAGGTVSVVNLSTFKVTDSIETGLHPTGMAFWGRYLLVANAYSDNISVIDTNRNEVSRTIDLGLPIGVPGEAKPAYGAGPNSIAVDAKNNIAYVALYNANAIAVVNLNDNWLSPVMGMIPVAYAPSSVVLDTVDNALIVANDKGIGAKGIPPQNSLQTSHGVTDYGTHQDLGTVSIVPVPKFEELWGMTQQVFQNNHWDLFENIFAAAGGNPRAEPLAIPERIGSPSKIKHIFVIIRENRTYDQILGDVSTGNGDASLAVFGNNATFGFVTPNAHALVQRFPLLDNFYDPSRQSADGHNWIVQAMAPYSDDVQSPDWLRDYPSNGGEALAYQNKGHLWDVAAKAGVSFKNYGEYIEYNTFNPPAQGTPPKSCTPTDYPLGSTTPEPFIASDSCEPLWIDFYNDTRAYETGAEKQLYNINTVASHSPLPNLINNTVQNYPQFDLDIPDQFRFDIWNEDFQNDVNHGTVPQLEFMWISSDHTGGPPTAQAMQADNDLALGRFVDAISHSAVWKDSAIFVEEDDAQDGVDHVDGHRSPGYIFSPYVIQSANGYTESTFYTQVNMTRTIEQILGLKPMNQFDLWASPMRTLFVDDPPEDNFLPWTHVPNVIPLNTGVTETPTQPIPAAIVKNIPTASPAATSQVARNESPAVKALREGWMKKKAEVFAGKYQTPDAEDPATVNHLDWYESTGFTRPYPGEKTVRPASDFNNPAPAGDKDDDDDGDGI